MVSYANNSFSLCSCVKGRPFFGVRPSPLAISKLNRGGESGDLSLGSRYPARCATLRNIKQQS